MADARTARPPASPADPGAAVAHLRGSDPVLAALIDAVGPLADPRPGRPDRNDHYGALVRSIVGQQLSTRAAAAIYGRLLAYFDGHPPTPQQVIDANPGTMRAAAGLSRAKVSYLRSLAEHVLSGDLRLDLLDDLSDDEVIGELTAVRGLGEWSAHMFLMFHLHRPDVMAVGDLGIRRAVERAWGLDAMPSPAQLLELSQPWRPHRTLACRYLWNSLANAPI
jgi:DNA-3-methyladenine glycosylase II